MGWGGQISCRQQKTHPEAALAVTSTQDLRKATPKFLVRRSGSMRALLHIHRSSSGGKSRGCCCCVAFAHGDDDEAKGRRTRWSGAALFSVLFCILFWVNCSSCVCTFIVCVVVATLKRAFGQICTKVNLLCLTSRVVRTTLSFCATASGSQPHPYPIRQTYTAAGTTFQP